MEPLFTIPIEAIPNHAGGTITCTSPKPQIYLLTWNSPPDNRLTPPFCKALLSALDVIEFGGYKTGVVITTSAIPKFYSNGLDLQLARTADGFWPLFYGLWHRFLTFPMPTLSLMNGHAFAGGLMLATAHDYRLAPSPRGYLCLNEVIFGAPLSPAMAAIMRTKYPAQTFRDIILQGHRFTADQAVTAGIADGIATSLEDALKFIDERKLVDMGKSGVYAALKREMYKDLCGMLKGPGLEVEEARFAAENEAEEERKEFGRVWYEQWSKENKSKL